MSSHSDSHRSTPESTPDESTARRIRTGFLWGVLATIAMSIPMLLGMSTGISPIPRPVPVAIVSSVFGSGLSQALLVVLAAGSHLAYGGVWGALLFWGRRNVTVAVGLGVGALLWLFMQMAVLPLIGWGAFGLHVTPAIAAATLVLHLIYGGVLGWGLS